MLVVSASFKGPLWSFYDLFRLIGIISCLTTMAGGSECLSIDVVIYHGMDMLSSRHGFSLIILYELK